jgi:hypothetical protein
MFSDLLTSRSAPSIAWSNSSKQGVSSIGQRREKPWPSSSTSRWVSNPTATIRSFAKAALRSPNLHQAQRRDAKAVPNVSLVVRTGTLLGIRRPRRRRRCRRAGSRTRAPQRSHRPFSRPYRAPSNRPPRECPRRRECGRPASNIVDNPYPDPPALLPFEAQHGTVRNASATSPHFWRAVHQPRWDFC